MVKNIIGLIPARRGSRRIPNKNFKLLGGEPLLRYTIKAALEANIFDKIIVSSNRPKCHNILAEYPQRMRNISPALIFWQRSEGISQDTSPDHEWIREIFNSKYPDNPAIQQCVFPDHYMILRPSNPFRTQETIKRAWQKYQDFGFFDMSMKSVESVSQRPEKMWAHIGTNHNPFMAPIMLAADKNGITLYEKQSTTFMPVYIQNGCIDICPTSILKRTTNRYIGNMILPFFTKDYEGFDLNTQEDWDRAEEIIKKNE